jgi:hypothetical protein
LDPNNSIEGLGYVKVKDAKQCDSFPQPIHNYISNTLLDLHEAPNTLPIRYTQRIQHRAGCGWLPDHDNQSYPAIVARKPLLRRDQAGYYVFWRDGA